MSERALSFGAMAEAYERYRPGYPDELFSAVIAHAGRPVRTALEVGAGTGKATRLFAGRGIAITATDPDPDMLTELREHVPAKVRTERAAFEDLPITNSYDLVYSAAALHWTRPEGRWDRMAALVEPGGVFANFGGPVQLADPAIDDAVRTARAPFLAGDDVPSPDGTPPEQPMQWPGTELEKDERFTDVRQLVIERRFRMTADDFVGHLSTVSAYLELAPATRGEALARIREAVPQFVDINADIIVHLARRVGDHVRGGGRS